MVRPGNTNSAISVLRSFAHVAETALSTAETEDIRRRYASRVAAKTDSRVISKARVITGKEVMKLQEQRNQKDKLATEKATPMAAKTKRHGKVASRAPKVPNSTTCIFKSLLILGRRLQ
jgi:hypothetical protein